MNYPKWVPSIMTARYDALVAEGVPEEDIERAVRPHLQKNWDILEAEGVDSLNIAKAIGVSKNDLWGIEEPKIEEGRFFGIPKDITIREPRPKREPVGPLGRLELETKTEIKPGQAVYYEKEGEIKELIPPEEEVIPEFENIKTAYGEQVEIPIFRKIKRPEFGIDRPDIRQEPEKPGAFTTAVGSAVMMLEDVGKGLLTHLAIKERKRLIPKEPIGLLDEPRDYIEKPIEQWTEIEKDNYLRKNIYERLADKIKLIPDDVREEVRRVSNVDYSIENLKKNPKDTAKGFFAGLSQQAALMLEGIVAQKTGAALGTVLGGPGMGTAAGHVAGVAAMALVEMQSFQDEAKPIIDQIKDKNQKIELQRNIDEKSIIYSLGSGAIEYSGLLFGAGKYYGAKTLPRGAAQALKNKISAPLLKNLLKPLGYVGGSVWEGAEELTQSSLSNYLLADAIEEMKKKYPDFMPEWTPQDVIAAAKAGTLYSLVLGGIGITGREMIRARRRAREDVERKAKEWVAPRLVPTPTPEKKEITPKEPTPAPAPTPTIEEEKPIIHAPEGEKKFVTTESIEVSEAERNYERLRDQFEKELGEPIDIQDILVRTRRIERKNKEIDRPETEKRHIQYLINATFDGVYDWQGRRALDEAMAELKGRKIDFNIISFDINNQKGLNENFGYEKTNELLRNVIKRTTEEEIEKSGLDAMPYRRGGDESVVIVVGGKAETDILKKNIQDAINAKRTELAEQTDKAGKPVNLLNLKNPRHDDMPSGALNIFAGVAESKDYKNIHDLLRAADSEMEEQKENFLLDIAEKTGYIMDRQGNFKAGVKRGQRVRRKVRPGRPVTEPAVAEVVGPEPKPAPREETKDIGIEAEVPGLRRKILPTVRRLRRYNDPDAVDVIRHRIRSPEDFIPRSIKGLSEWGGVIAPKGVKFLVGDLTPALGGGKEIQAISHDPALWTEDTAEKWYETIIKNKPQFVEKWTGEDWIKEGYSPRQVYKKVRPEKIPPHREPRPAPTKPTEPAPKPTPIPEPIPIEPPPPKPTPAPTPQKIYTKAELLNYSYKRLQREVRERRLKPLGRRPEDLINSLLIYQEMQLGDKLKPVYDLSQGIIADYEPKIQTERQIRDWLVAGIKFTPKYEAMTASEKRGAIRKEKEHIRKNMLPTLPEIAAENKIRQLRKIYTFLSEESLRISREIRKAKTPEEIEERKIARKKAREEEYEKTKKSFIEQGKIEDKHTNAMYLIMVDILNEADVDKIGLALNNIYSTEQIRDAVNDINKGEAGGEAARAIRSRMYDIMEYGYYRDKKYVERAFFGEEDIREEEVPFYRKTKEEREAERKQELKIGLNIYTPELLARIPKDSEVEIVFSPVVAFGDIYRKFKAGERAYVIISENKAKIVLNPEIQIDALESVLAHEILGHFGAIKVLETNKRILERIKKIYEQDKDSDFWKEIKYDYRDAPDDVIFQEWLARRLEQHYLKVGPRSSVAARIVAILKSWLAKIPGMPKNIRLDGILQEMMKEMRIAKIAPKVEEVEIKEEIPEEIFGDHLNIYERRENAKKPEAEIYFKKVGDIYEQYPQYKKEIDYFIENDPAGNKKYLDWQLKILDSGQALEFEIADVTKLFHKYSGNLEKKDIYQYEPEDFTELRNELLEIAGEKLGRKKEISEEDKRIEEQIIKAGTEEIYESDNYRMMRISNRLAAAHYGDGTEWCISNPERGWFENYDANNIVFYFIMAKPDIIVGKPYKKVAVSVPRDNDNRVIEGYIEYWDIPGKSYKLIEKVIPDDFTEDQKKIVNLIMDDAPRVPKSIGAKISTGEASEKEYFKYIKIAQRAPDDVKEKMIDVVLRSKIKYKSVFDILYKNKDSKVRAGVAQHSNTPVDILKELAKDFDLNVRESVAYNYHAPPDALAILAKDDYADIRKQVAKNPRTPRNILAILAKDVDDDVRFSIAQNHHAHPDALAELAKDTRASIRSFVVQNSNTPPNILAILARDNDVHIRGYVAYNRNTTPDVLMELAKEMDDAIRRNVARNINTPSDVLELLAKDNDVSVRIQVAHNPHISPDVMAILAKDKNVDVKIIIAEKFSTSPNILALLAKDVNVVIKSYVARNSSTPPDVLMELAKDRKVIIDIIKNPSTPPNVLAELAKDDYAKIREIVAENHNTPVDVLAELAKDAHANVRISVAKNRNTPADVLALLAKDDNVITKSYVARNSNTSPDTLTMLAKDRNEDVKGDVAQNFRTPADALALLAKDSNKRIRKIVAENNNTPPNVLAELAKDNIVIIRRNVAKNHQTPPDTLAELAKDDKVKIDVVKNPSTPPNVLALLAKDVDVVIKSYVARNSNTPPDVLELLAKDDSNEVKRKVAGNPSTPPNVLAELAKDVDVKEYVAQNFRTPADVLALLAKDDDVNVMVSVAENNNTPPDVLAELAKDVDMVIKNYVARNSNTPPDVLELLAKDDSNEVKREVAGNPSTPPNVLAELAKKDKSPSVQKTAQETLKKIQAEKQILFSKIGAPEVQPAKVDYERIKDMPRKKVQPEFARKRKQIGRIIERNFKVLSERLRDINKDLLGLTRETMFNINTKITERKDRYLKFADAIKKMSKEDLAVFEYAENAGDKEKIIEILKKYNLLDSYEKNKRAILKEIYEEAKNAGIEIGYLEDENYWYAPRNCRDRDGLAKEILRERLVFPPTAKQEDIDEILKNMIQHGFIADALKNKQKIIGDREHRPMTNIEIGEVLDSLLSGGMTGVMPAKPGFAKERRIMKFKPEYMKYYDENNIATMKYIENLTTAIELRKFFGKSAIIEDNKLDIDKSIGQLSSDLAVKGEIRLNQLDELKSILDAIFRPTKTNDVVAAIKNIGYIDLIGNIYSTITQISDIYWAIYTSNVFNTLKAILRKRGVTLKDIGTMEIAHEYSNLSRSGKWLKTVLGSRLVGMTRGDKWSKEVLINAIFYHNQRLARKNPLKLAKDIKWMFGDEKLAEQAVNDLASGETTRLAKLVSFNNLLDFHPVTEMEVPEGYAKDAGFKKLFVYYLRTYSIKQFNSIRREVVQELKKGNKIKAAKNLIYLAGLMYSFNFARNVIIDFLSGRDWELEDTALDSLLQIAMLPRFVLWKVRREGISKGLVSLLTPPFRYLDSITKDLWAASEGKIKGPNDLEIIRDLPAVGAPYFWWFGKGAKLEQTWADKRLFETYSEANAAKMKYQKLLKEDKAKARAYKLKNYKKITAWDRESVRQLDKEIKEIKKKRAEARQKGFKASEEYYTKRLESKVKRMNLLLQE